MIPYRKVDLIRSLKPRHWQSENSLGLGMDKVQCFLNFLDSEKLGNNWKETPNPQGIVYLETRMFFFLSESNFKRVMFIG